jgi:hypothetical protein
MSKNNVLGPLTPIVGFGKLVVRLCSFVDPAKKLMKVWLFVFFCRKIMDGVRAIRLAFRFSNETRGLWSRGFHTSKTAFCFHESHPKGGYQKKDERPVNEKVRHGFTQLKEEIKVWKKEVKETFEMDFPIIRPGNLIV